MLGCFGKILLYCTFSILESGQKALQEAGGIQILYENALEVSDCRDMESMILLATVIMRKCFPRNKLPIASTLNPVLFLLPQSPSHTPECYFLPNFPGRWDFNFSLFFTFINVCLSMLRQERERERKRERDRKRERERERQREREINIPSQYRSCFIPQTYAFYVGEWMYIWMKQ